MAYSKIKFDLTGGVCTLALNDPATLNSAGLAMMSELGDAIVQIGSGDIAARAVILTGEGKGFCSGANLAESASAGGDAAPEDRLGTIFNPLLKALRDLPVPLVTAINGVAAGIGSSIALMGDLIVMNEDAYLLQAFRRIGLVPDGGATWMLPRLVGKARAMELMLLGEKLPAKTALDWGLVNRVTSKDDLLPTAQGLAQQLATGPASLGMIRQLVWENLSGGHDAALEAERQMQKKAKLTEDHREGIAAFHAKRPAGFVGR
jgi:2-(1,2-epoxy-1,2-dihydrophenyl)acetyl-CoA isomerase